LRDLVVLAGEEIDAVVAAAVLVQHLLAVAPPVLIVGGEDQPAVPHLRLVGPDLHRDERPLAEAREDGSAEVALAIVLRAERLERRVDDPLGRRDAVVPRVRAVAAIFGPLRADDPAELRADARPLAAVLDRVAAAAVEVHQDGAKASDARLVIVG